MARAVWLAAVLRKAGCRVVELDGWQTRETRPGFEPHGIVWHHTVTGPNVSNLTVRKLLRDGRADLPGPLCQLGLERDGTFVVVAAGRANHAGYGVPWGNDSIGIEAYNNGTTEPWPKVQLDAWEVGTAAICTALGVGAPQVKAHREVDPNRKVDPHTISMDAARARIADLLTPKPTPPQEDDSMFIMKGTGYATRFVDPPVCVPIGATTEKGLVAEGVKVLPFSQPDAAKIVAQCGQALTDEDVVAAIEADT